MITSKKLILLLKIKMKFNIYIKVKDSYELRELKPETDANKKFFKSVLLLVDEQLEIIKKDILSYFNKGESINLSVPKHESYLIQKKINLLVKIRKTNLVTRDNLKSLLSEHEFIICTCGAKMYKSPINVIYEKIGNSFIVTDKNIFRTEYKYNCESCWRCIGVNEYEQKLKNKELKKGYTYVPNEFGFWSYISDSNYKKSPDMVSEKIEARERIFEKITIKGKQVFMKITEVEKNTGKVKHIL